MTLRHLTIFCALCDNGFNTTRAAEILHMSQPAVSLAIKELEEHYGVLLFDRIGRRLQITEAGKTFFDYAQHISSLFLDMETSLHNWDSQGVLRVGASITIGSQFMPSYVKVFSYLYPRMEVFVKVMDSDTLQTMILRNEIDLALIEGIATDEAILSEDYMEDSLSVVVAHDGKWTQGQRISLEEFKQLKFLLREPGSGSRRVFDRVTESSGFLITPIWESSDTTALIQAASYGLGAAILPRRMVAEHVANGQVITIEVEGLDFRRSFRIIRHKDKMLTPSVKAFLELCRNYEDDYPSPHQLS